MQSESETNKLTKESPKVSNRLTNNRAINKNRQIDLEQLYQTLQQAVQDRVDELYLLEKKANMRMQTFQDEFKQVAIKFAQTTREVLKEQTKDICQDITNRIMQDLQSNQTKLFKGIKLFVPTAILSTTLLVFSVWTFIHKHNEIDLMRTDFLSFVHDTEKSKNILSINGEAYAIIESGSESTITFNGKRVRVAKLVLQNDND